jgi:hypothetical protein
MIQIDFWGGKYSQKLVKSCSVDNWLEAHKLIEEGAEGGLLINIIMTDFVAGLLTKEISDRSNTMN